MDSEAVDLDFDEGVIEDDHLQQTEVEKETEKHAPISPPSGVQSDVQQELPPLRKGKRDEVSVDEMKKLYNDLDVTSGDFVLRSVVAKGVDDMTAFDVERVFAEYRPYRVELLEDVSAIVHFLSRSDAATMMINMTKRLRRVRGAKKAEEEGEVLDSSEEEEEEGVLKEEHGDDVEVIEKGEDHKPKKHRNQFVQVDVDVVHIPDGRWRVVTEHVPDRRLLIVRFASRKELEGSRTKVVDGGGLRKKKAELDDEGYSYKWSNDEKVRPGLNVFTSDGKELEWDFEHDTRFYEDPSSTGDSSEDAEIKKWGKEEGTVEDDAKGKPKVRGRGASRAFLALSGQSQTMRADGETGSSRTSHRHSIEEEDSEDRLSSRISWKRGRDSPDNSRDTSPTPQPWEKKKKTVHNRVTW